jgi:hypothetical protein
MRRLALVVITALVVGICSFRARGVASPRPSWGSGSDEIEMDPEGSGSGSAGSGSDSTAPVKDPKVAKKWLGAAHELVAKGDALAKQKKLDDAKPQWENAATAFEKAIEAGDDINVYVELAMVEDKLDRFAEAVAHYKQVIGGTGAKPATVKQAQAKLDELSARVGYVTLTVLPDETTIMLGDKQLGVSPLKQPLVMAPGTYTLSLSSAGYESKDIEIKVDAGSESERKIELPPKKIEVHVEPPEPPPPPPPPPEVPMWPLYAGAGATAGLVVTATITGIAAISKHHTFTAPDTSHADRLDAQANGKTLAHVTDACLGGAVIAAGFTAYYYLYRYKPAQDTAPAKHDQAKLDVLPWVQPQAGGITVVGKF